MSNVKVGKIDSRKYFQIGNELIEVADYNIKSSADGSTELSVIIKGNASMSDMSVNLIEKKNISTLQQRIEDFKDALYHTGESPWR